jgi:hypothetical protein
MVEQKKGIMKQKIEKLTVFYVFVTVFFCGGCGIVGLMGTPSQYEKYVPAEYDLAGQKGKKILILVEQPSWLSAKVSLRYRLTEAIRENLTGGAKIPNKDILSYGELSKFSSGRSDFSSLSPAAVGKALGADIVLLIKVEDCELNNLAGTGYYTGSLSVQAAIFETDGEQVWPKDAAGKRVKVSFDTGEKGQDATLERLVNACAFCTSRCLYNCPKYKFKTSDEQGDIGWDSIGGD